MSPKTSDILTDNQVASINSMSSSYGFLLKFVVLFSGVKLRISRIEIRGPAPQLDVVLMTRDCYVGKNIYIYISTVYIRYNYHYYKIVITIQHYSTNLVYIQMVLV